MECVAVSSAVVDSLLVIFVYAGAGRSGLVYLRDSSRRKLR